MSGPSRCRSGARHQGSGGAVLRLRRAAHVLGAGAGARRSIAARSRVCATGCSATSRSGAPGWCFGTSPVDGACTPIPMPRGRSNSSSCRPARRGSRRRRSRRSAIVAYKQPVTRHQVSGDPRGQLRRGAPRARRPRPRSKRPGARRRPGRPMLYATTPQFLERLGLPSLAALPSLAPLLDLDAPRTRTTRRRRRPPTIPPTGRRPSRRRMPRTRHAPRRPVRVVVAEERLQRALARAGFGSRRASEELIAQGRVTVNGTVATLGDKVEPARARSRSTVSRVNLDPNMRYYALHKPAGVVTTMRDPQGRPDMRAYLPSEGPRVFPVGRLDRDSEGLLLLTNDGDLANRLIAPAVRRGEGVPRRGRRDARPPRQIARIRRGVELDDGPATAMRARIVDTRPGRGQLRHRHDRGPQARGPPAARGGRPAGHAARPPAGRTGHARWRSPPGAMRELTPEEIAGRSGPPRPACSLVGPGSVPGAPRRGTIAVRVRAARGAIVVARGRRPVLSATERLLGLLLDRNAVEHRGPRQHPVHCHRRPAVGVPRRGRAADGSRRACR